jgi:hypothetical protein
LGAHPVLLFAHRQLQVLLRNLAAPHGGQLRVDRRIAYIGLDAPESERQRDQGKKNLGDFLVVADDIKPAE